MAKFKHLTTEERKIIIKLYYSGKSMREIAKIVGKSATSVFKTINAFKFEGRISENKRTGRPRMTAKRLDLRIQNISSTDPSLSAPKIQAMIKNESKNAPSTQTIRRRLHEVGKHGRVARKVPFISKVNKGKRMQFYQEHILKPLEFWSRVLWTDESMVRLKYSHGRMYVWRKKSEVLSFKCTQPTLKTLDKGLMVWGCMCSSGVGKIVIIEGKMNAAVYLNLLKETVIPEGYRLIGENFILQQDNAPIHRAKTVDRYLTECYINVLQWPPQSPDLSPIENLWDVLKTRIAEKAPRNLAELRSLISEKWYSITPTDCHKYVHSLPTRLAKLSHNNGGHCGY